MTYQEGSNMAEFRKFKIEEIQYFNQGGAILTLHSLRRNSSIS
jgi:hypothetical protein